MSARSELPTNQSVDEGLAVTLRCLKEVETERDALRSALAESHRRAWSDSEVEVAARALCRCDGLDPDLPSGNVEGPMWVEYRGDAEAVLTAVSPQSASAMHTHGESERLVDVTKCAPAYSNEPGSRLEVGTDDPTR